MSELSQPAVGAALLLSPVRLALMFQGQRDDHGVDAVIGGAGRVPWACLARVAALVSLGPACGRSDPSCGKI